MSAGNRNDSAGVLQSAFRGDGGTGNDTSPTSDYSINEVYENGNVVTREVESSARFTAVPGSFCHIAVRFFEAAGSARSMSMKRKWSPSAVGTGSVNKKNLVMAMPLTALPLIAGVKVQGVVAENASCSGIELRSAGSSSYELWKIAIEICVHGVRSCVSKAAGGSEAILQGYRRVCML